MGKIDGGKCGFWKIVPAPAGAAFGATKSKSANTNPRHAHRLFSSDHQPAQASRTSARLPSPHIIPSSGSMEMRALPSGL